MSRGFHVNFSCPELQGVLQNIERYNTRQAVKVEQAVSTSTKNIAKGARQRVPIRTGDLKKSVRSNFDIRKIQGTVRAKEFYAHMIEFGTKPHNIGNGHHPGTTARPFLRPAYEDEKPNLIKNVKDAVKP